MANDTSILIDTLGYFNLIAIPIYCFKRFKSNSYLSLMNPCFYLVLFSYLYLTFASVLLGFYIQALSQVGTWIDLKLMEPTKLLGNWFTLVFFIFYIFSKDYNLVILPFKPRKLTYKIAFILTFIVSIVLVTIAILYIPSLLTFSNRTVSYEFSQEFIRKFKMKLLVNILLGCIAVLVWRTKNFKWYLPILIPIAIDLAAKGRSLTFNCIIFAYLNYIAISQKSIIFKIITVLGIVVGTVIFRLSDEARESTAYLWSVFADLFLSWITTLLVYKNFLGYGDIFSYIGNSLLSLLPFDSLLGIEQNKVDYVQVLAEFYQQKLNLKFGLAGNIVSESLFYGGLTFAIISPIIIGSIFYFFNRFTIYKNFPGFIFFCFLIANFRGMVRDSFYDGLLQCITLMLSGLIWLTILEYKRPVIIKKSNLKFTTDSIDVLNSRS